MLSIRRWLAGVGLLLIQASSSLEAESLRGEFQLLPEPIDITALDAITAPKQGYSEHEEAIHELADDARWIFSGMIYGYSVTWIPPFNARGIEEKFEIELMAQIPVGNEKLRTLSVNEIDGIVYILMEYASDFMQQKRLEAWKSSLFPSATGEASSPILGGSRREALEMAIKEAIRNHFKQREFNQPQSIQTKIALAEFPQIGLGNGKYRALVSIRIGLNNVRHYEID